MNFVLGLEAGGFMSSLGAAGNKLGGFTRLAAGFTGVTAAMAAGLEGIKGMANVVSGVMGAFETGRALNQLSAVTGESVASLVKLQAGLRAAGMDASAAGGMITSLQRSLGGVNEAGQPTGHIFRQLGLHIAELKQIGAPEAIALLADRMSKLNNASATAAARAIFHFAGGEFLGAARNAEEFRKAIAAAADRATLWQRNAGAFAKVARTFDELKEKSKGLFLGIAAGLAPGLQRIGDALAKIDLTAFGKKLGDVIGLLVESMRNGKFSEVFSLSIQAGFERAMPFVEKFVSAVGTGMAAGIAAAIPSALQAAGQAAKSGLASILTISDEIFASGVERQIKKLAAQKQAAPGSWTPSNEKVLTGLQANYAQATGRANAGVQEIERARNASFVSIASSIADGVKGALQASMEAWKNTKPTMETDATKKLAGLLANFRAAGQKEGPGQNPAAQFGANLLAAYKPSFTALEKLGFGSRGAHALASDHARRTAENTGKLVDLFGKLAGKTGPFVGDIFMNTHAV